jgi:hypothetical protein
VGARVDDKHEHDRALTITSITIAILTIISTVAGIGAHYPSSINQLSQSSCKS